MRVSILTTLALLFVLAGADNANAEEAVIFEDQFNEKLGDGWTWMQQNDEAWRIKDGALEFRVRGKDIVLSCQLPSNSEGPLAVEVTLASVPQPTRQFEQGGFAWFFDGKQQFKYVKELIDGKTYVFPGKKEMPAATVQLRIELRGGKFTALFRPDGQGEFQTAFSGDLPNKGEGKHQIALMCYNGPGDAEHWMRFDNFRIVKLSE